MVGDISLTYILASGLVIFFAIGLHEYAHCKMADLAGDPTPRYYGRVTLDLTKHFELWGTIMIIITTLTGFGIGWGKPAPCNPSKMRNPRWDHFMTVAAGPLSNLLQAAVWAIVYRATFMVMPGLFYHSEAFLPTFLTLAVIINVALALFNLIPIGMLDGHWLLGLLMPEPQRTRWFQFNRSIGMYFFLFLIFGDQFLRNATGFSILDTILVRPTLAIAGFLLGI